MFDDPNEGFPWDKVDAAKRYLYLVKPWWSRYAEAYPIVPVSARTFGAERFGMTTSTDISGRIYVDRQFALAAPLHLLSGSIEHEILHHVKDTWNRMSYLSEEEWEAYANIGMDLEINSILQAENASLHYEKIREKARSSSMFSIVDMQKWNVSASPGLGDDAWLPSRIELPESLSAERYVGLLRSSDALGGDEAQDDDGLADGESEDGSSASEEQQNDNQAESEGDADHAREHAEDTDQSEGESASDGNEESDSVDAEQDNVRGDDATEPDASESSESDQESDSQQSPSSSSEAPERAESDDNASDAAEHDNAAASDAERDSERADDVSDDDADNAASNENEEERQSDAQASSDQGQPSAETAEKVEELRSSGLTKYQARSLSNPSDDFTEPHWKPDDDEIGNGMSSFAQSEAEKMLLEDLEAFAEQEGGNDFGLGEGGTPQYLEDWADTYKRKHGLNWETHFARLLNAQMNSAKIKGQSDLSMSVRNPHQPPIGVVLPGLHDYTPDIYVLQDVSGSMRHDNRIQRSMDVFADLASKAFGRFGAETTWITADMKIEAVGKASSWRNFADQPFQWTFGGTDLGTTIEQIATKGFTHERRRYPKPDLLILATDCGFRWPERRPKNSCRLLVLDLDAERSERFLPEWLNRRTEYVAVD